MVALIVVAVLVIVLGAPIGMFFIIRKHVENGPIGRAIRPQSVEQTNKSL